jgi:hypothetical protein
MTRIITAHYYAHTRVNIAGHFIITALLLRILRIIIADIIASIITARYHYTHYYRAYTHITAKAD